jgi:hypothetical protein
MTRRTRLIDVFSAQATIGKENPMGARDQPAEEQHPGLRGETGICDPEVDRRQSQRTVRQHSASGTACARSPRWFRQRLRNLPSQRDLQGDCGRPSKAIRPRSGATYRKREAFQDRT